MFKLPRRELRQRYNANKGANVVVSEIGPVFAGFTFVDSGRGEQLTVKIYLVIVLREFFDTADIKPLPDLNHYKATAYLVLGDDQQSILLPNATTKPLEIPDGDSSSKVNAAEFGHEEWFANHLYPFDIEEGISDEALIGVGRTSLVE